MQGHSATAPDQEARPKRMRAVTGLHRTARHEWEEHSLSATKYSNPMKWIGQAAGSTLSSVPEHGPCIQDACLTSRRTSPMELSTGLVDDYHSRGWARGFETQSCDAKTHWWRPRPEKTLGLGAPVARLSVGRGGGKQNPRHVKDS
jgi:hypothetical protein